MVTVSIPNKLRELVEGKHSITVHAKTLADVSEAVTTQYPLLAASLFDEHRRLKSFLRAFLNGEAIEFEDSDRSALSETCTIVLLSAVAGG